MMKSLYFPCHHSDQYMLDSGHHPALHLAQLAPSSTVLPKTRQKIPILRRTVPIIVYAKWSGIPRRIPPPKTEMWARVWKGIQNTPRENVTQNSMQAGRGALWIRSSRLFSHSGKLGQALFAGRTVGGRYPSTAAARGWTAAGAGAVLGTTTENLLSARVKGSTTTSRLQQ